MGTTCPPSSRCWRSTPRPTSSTRSCRSSWASSSPACPWSARRQHRLVPSAQKQKKKKKRKRKRLPRRESCSSTTRHTLKHRIPLDSPADALSPPVVGIGKKRREEDKRQQLGDFRARHSI